MEPDLFDEQSFLTQFSKEEIRFGIDQFAEVKLGMTGEVFISKVRAGEPVHQLHKRAQEVANLVSLLDN